VSDGQSDGVRARLDAEAFLEDHGWGRSPLEGTRLVLWTDPVRPDAEPMWRHEAADLQLARNELVRQVMEF
jgi:hypothetical protein